MMDRIFSDLPFSLQVVDFVSEGICTRRTEIAHEIAQEWGGIALSIRLIQMERT
jgi:hypothetical protein